MASKQQRIDNYTGALATGATRSEIRDMQNSGAINADQARILERQATR